MTESDADFALTLTRFDDVEAFATVVEPILMRHEAANCLQLGLLSDMRAGQHPGSYLAAITADGSDPLMPVIRTPGYRLILAEPETTINAPALLEPLIGQLPADLPGVLGPDALATAFAEGYCARHGLAARRTTSERIYQCSHAQAPRGVAGAMRRAGEDDRELLIDWRRAFRDEAAPHEPDRTEQSVARDLAADPGGLWLWEASGEPVAMAGVRGPTPSGIRIGPVFTPRERRGNGYAGALVGGLTQQLLNEGRRFVFLFTDLENPTSNSLYQRLGYQGVADRSAYDFSA